MVQKMQNGAGAAEHLHKVPELAAYWNTSQRSIWRLIAAGELKPVRLGRSVRIRASDANALVAKGGTR